MSSDAAASPRDMFMSLEGRKFHSYRAFDEAVQSALGQYRSAFPLTYTPLQAIAWARQNDWIKDNSDGLLVEVSAEQT